MNIPKSTILGAIPDNTKFTSGEFSLESEDLLFLYTDGILDAKDKNGNFFKKENLKLFLRKNVKQSSEIIIDNLKREISEFTKETPQNDDITILALKYK